MSFSFYCCSLLQFKRFYTHQGPGSPGKRHLSRGGGDEKSAKKMKLSAVGGKPLELIGSKGNQY
jgi:hypothetical protein